MRIPAQERLCHGSVLVVGAGGLGSAALLYLVGAGIGRVGIVDKDTVALNNLHRQIIHKCSSIRKANGRDLSVGRLPWEKRRRHQPDKPAGI